MLWTWQHAMSTPTSFNEGDLDKALGAITPTRCHAVGTDLYFTVEDSRREVARMPRPSWRPIPSIWGHRAGTRR